MRPLLTYFGMEGCGIPLQAGFYGPGPFLFMFQVVKAVDTIAVITEFTIGKAITISTKGGKRERLEWYVEGLSVTEVSLWLTYSFKHCDLVQLQGFLGREFPGSDEELEKTK